MSTAIETNVHFTPEDLLALPGGENYELVGGHLLERKVGFESGWVAGRLIVRLGRHSEEPRLGWIFPADSGYQCFPHDPGLVRKPDVSFIRRGRLPGGILPKGWAKIPPDLVVEVVAPNDLAEELEEKQSDYRRAGVPLVWIVYPGARTVRIHRADGSTDYLDEHGELSGEDVIPGFRCPVREILPLREHFEEAEPAPTGVDDGPGR